MSNVEKRASLLIKYRKLKVKKKEKEEDKTTYFLSRGDSNFIFLCIVGQRGIGIAYVRELRDLVKETGSDKGVIITNVKYTWSARFNARAHGKAWHRVRAHREFPIAASKRARL